MKPQAPPAATSASAATSTGASPAAPGFWMLTPAPALPEIAVKNSFDAIAPDDEPEPSEPELCHVNPENCMGPLDGMAMLFDNARRFPVLSLISF